MSQIIYALTSNSDAEIAKSIATLKSAAVKTGYMHESYNKDDSANFTRAWFAWANTLFGELIVKTAESRPALLK
jgi:meiotically up-regulated gene 157 (Mug157) protein